MRMAKGIKGFVEGLQKDWNKAGVQVPLDGSETKSATELRKRVRKAGGSVSQSDARKIARAARKSAK